MEAQTKWLIFHYNDIMMSVMASQITSLSIVYATVCSDTDQRKHQSSVSLAFVRGIHKMADISLQRRHDECHGISNNQPLNCLLNCFSGADQRKHQISASLAFVRGIHQWLVNSPHKRPVTRKMFPFDDIMMLTILSWYHIKYDITKGHTP